MDRKEVILKAQAELQRTLADLGQAIASVNMASERLAFVQEKIKTVYADQKSDEREGL